MFNVHWCDQCAFLVLLLCDQRLLLHHITSPFSWGDDVWQSKSSAVTYAFPALWHTQILNSCCSRYQCWKKCHSRVVIFHCMHPRQGLIACVSCQGDTVNMHAQATDSLDSVLEYLISSGGVELCSLCQVSLTQSFTSANPGGIHLDEKRLKSGLWNTEEDHMALESYKYSHIHLSAELVWWTAQAPGHSWGLWAN